jgi:preprotein translocase SecF subunit
MFKKLREKNDKMWAKFHNPNTKISKWGKIYIIFPLILVVVAGGLLIAQACGVRGVGINLGLDFTGGSVVEATGFTDEGIRDAAKAEVEKFLKDNNIAFDITTPNSASTGLGLSVKYQGENADIGKGIVDRMERVNGETTGADVKSTETISASASGERIMITFISIAVTLLAILIYILFRFKFTSGIASVIGLIHDVLVVCALCVIFRVQINYPFVAAIITLVVYSLNNTIVLFDRVRGKEKLNKQNNARVPVEQTVDESIKETFSRTLGTTVTTLVPVIVLCCLPIALIREFALPILFGLIAGTFSTIFITTILYVRFESYRAIRRRAKERANNNLTPAQNLVK